MTHVNYRSSHNVIYKIAHVVFLVSMYFDFMSLVTSAGRLSC
jgi:hypothetical protein